MSGPINIRDVIRAHDRFKRLHETMVEKETRDAAEHVEDHVHAHPTFKPRTGALQKATTAQVIKRGRQTLIIRASNKAKHAKAIDGGARPHIIRARRRSALRFRAGGRLVFARAVNHPGNRAYKFLYRATTAAGRILQQGLASGMARIAKRF